VIHFSVEMKVMKVVKNDSVLVVTGNFKGKKGKVLKVFRKEERVIVEGVNFIKRHTRKSQHHRKGSAHTRVQCEGGVRQMRQAGAHRPDHDRKQEARPRVQELRRNARHVNVRRYQWSSKIMSEEKKESVKEFPKESQKESKKESKKDTSKDSKESKKESQKESIKESKKEPQKESPKESLKDYTPRLLVRYQKEIIPALQKRFGYSSIMQVPRLKKIVLNMGVGDAVTDPKFMEAAVADLTAISGQKVVVTKAKKAISNFKIREGMPIGCSVIMRRHRMYQYRHSPNP
jgi:ribosomal protein L24